MRNLFTLFATIALCIVTTEAFDSKVIDFTQCSSGNLQGCLVGVHAKYDHLRPSHVPELSVNHQMFSIIVYLGETSFMYNIDENIITPVKGPTLSNSQFLTFLQHVTPLIVDDIYGDYVTISTTKGRAVFKIYKNMQLDELVKEGLPF